MALEVMRGSCARRAGRAAAAAALGAALCAAVLSAGGGAALARDVVDSAGRVVETPETVSRVFAAGPPAAILLYALAPDRLTGWPRALRPEERPYIAEPYRDLPETGRLTGRGGTANLEAVIRDAPDMILDFGSVKGTFISLAERTQTQTGIPYLLVDGRFEATPTALRLVGGALGVEARADALAAYVETLFAELDAGLAAIPEADRPRVYLARGPDGLETGLKGSINTEIIERAGGRNVADPGDDANVRRGITAVSIEQVIVADPDTILTWDRRFYDRVWTDPLWAGITAVREKRVYLAPTAPFGWIDRPPSLNRVIGLRWLAGLFHPEAFPMDLRAETRRFYELFYRVALTEAELDRLIEWAGGRP